MYSLLPSCCSAVVLTGGRSKRFKAPKWQTQFAGHTLLDYATALARTLCDHYALVVGEDTTIRSKVPRIQDIQSGEGPMMAIYSAIKQINSDWLAVLPVDMPYLIPEIYVRLWQHREGNKPVVARSSKGLESLVSIWPRKGLPLIETMIQQGIRSIHQVLTELAATEICFPSDYDVFFSNVNYKEDLEYLEQKEPDFVQNYLFSGLPCLAIRGEKNAGKTTLLTWLIRELRREGLMVAAMKHSIHKHPVDKPGSDSDHFRKAGAEPSIFWSGEGTGLYFNTPLIPMQAPLLRLALSRAHLLLMESFSRYPLPCLWVGHGSSEAAKKNQIIAVVSDRKIKMEGIWPHFQFGERSLIDFLLQWLNNKKPSRYEPRGQ